MKSEFFLDTAKKKRDGFFSNILLQSYDEVSGN